MKPIKDVLLVVALSTLVLNLSGCGGINDEPKLGKVTGTVTMDGAPVSGIAVVFQPDDGRPARGKTDSAGKYELTYIGKTAGSKVGPNRVEIAFSEEGEEESANANEGENPGAAKPKRGKIAIPARYNTNSELKVDVKPGENVFDFKLESK